MNEDVELASEQLNLRFDGRLHEVDVTVFSRALLDFAEVVKAANRQAKSNANVDVRIKATGEGSFESIIRLVLSHPQNTLAVVQSADIIVHDIGAAVVGVYALRKWLARHDVQSASPNEETQQVVLTDVHGDSYTVQGNVYNMYSHDPAVTPALARTFGALDDDPAIAGFEILDDQRAVLFGSDHSDFGPMAAAPLPLADEDGTTRIQLVDASLYIVRVVLEHSRTRRWQFLWGGNRISAPIADERFLEQVDSGMPFAQGDVLRVKLERVQVYSPSIGTYETTGYTVREVIEHIPRADTGAMF